MKEGKPLNSASSSISFFNGIKEEFNICSGSGGVRIPGLPIEGSLYVTLFNSSISNHNTFPIPFQLPPTNTSHQKAHAFHQHL